MLHDLQERKLRHFFDVFDSDHDGLLEQSDFETYLQRMSEATGHRKGWDELQSRWMFVWTTLQAMGDVDHDKVVSPDEWLSLADQLLQSEQSYTAIMNGIGRDHVRPPRRRRRRAHLEGRVAGVLLVARDRRRHRRRLPPPRLGRRRLRLPGRDDGQPPGVLLQRRSRRSRQRVLRASVARRPWRTGPAARRRSPRRRSRCLRLAIEASGLAKRYPNGVEALAGVDFAIGWGVIFAYLGRNGSGKTTTVRVLTTLHPAHRGDGEGRRASTWCADPAGARKVMGVTMQEAALDHLMTGRNTCQLVGQLWGQPGGRRPAAGHRAAGVLRADRRRQPAHLHLLGRHAPAARHRHRPASTGPGCCSSTSPPPASTPRAGGRSGTRCGTPRDEGTAVFLTTQYLAEAEELADTVAILDAGRVVASGTVSQLKATFGRTTVRLRVADDPHRRGRGRRSATTRCARSATAACEVDLIGPGGREPRRDRAAQPAAAGGGRGDRAGQCPRPPWRTCSCG